MKSRIDEKWNGTPVTRDSYWYASARAAAGRAEPYSINTLVALMASDKWCVKAKEMDEFCNDIRREYPEVLSEKLPKCVMDMVADDVVAPVTDLIDLYTVSFSLGGDPTKIAYKFDIVGVPTRSDIREYLAKSVDAMRMRPDLDTGLPNHECSVLSQCLWMLGVWGFPALGDTKQCCAFDGCTVGWIHTSIVKRQTSTRRTQF